MIILDTNVVSALMLRDPEAVVVEWLNAQTRELIWITSITVFEVRFGIWARDPGHKQQQLSAAFDRFLDFLGGRVASFDAFAASEAARLAASRKHKGKPRGQHDTLIAGIAIEHGAALATRNTADFTDVPIPLINPWSE